MPSGRTTTFSTTGGSGRIVTIELVGRADQIVEVFDVGRRIRGVRRRPARAATPRAPRRSRSRFDLATALECPIASLPWPRDAARVARFGTADCGRSQGVRRDARDSSANCGRTGTGCGRSGSRRRARARASGCPCRSPWCRSCSGDPRSCRRRIPASNRISACSREMFSSSSVTSVVGLRPISVSSASSGYSMPSKPPLRITSFAPAMRPPPSDAPVFGPPRGAALSARPGPQRRRWRSAGTLARTRSSSASEQSATATPGRSPSWASTIPHGSTISERPWLARSGLWTPALCRRQHEALVLDRARAQQHLPVVLAGRARERARHEQPARAARGLRAVELGEAQVVADREPDAADLGLRHDHLVARRDALRLARTRRRRSRRGRRRTGGSCGRRPRSRRSRRSARSCCRRAPSPPPTRRSSRPGSARASSRAQPRTRADDLAVDALRVREALPLAAQEREHLGQRDEGRAAPRPPRARALPPRRGSRRGRRSR